METLRAALASWSLNGLSIGGRAFFEMWKIGTDLQSIEHGSSVKAAQECKINKECA